MIVRTHIDRETKSLLHDQPGLLAIAESIARSRESIAWSLRYGAGACCWNRRRAPRRKRQGHQ